MLIGIGASIYSGNRYDAAISSANLAACFDARLGVTESGAAVSQWADLSGNGRHFTQASGPNKPTYVTAGGLPYVDFDGVAQYMKTASFTVAQPVTMYLVVNVQTWLAGRTLIDKLSAPNFCAVYQTGASPQLQQFATANGAIVTPALALGTSGVICSVFNGASSSIKLNMNAKATGSPGTVGLDGLTIGVRNDLGVGTYADMRAHALLVYSGAHDDSVQSNINRALMARWGVA